MTTPIPYEIKEDGIYLQTRGLIVWLQAVKNNMPDTTVYSRELIAGICKELVSINKEIIEDCKQNESNS